MQKNSIRKAIYSLETVVAVLLQERLPAWLKAGALALGTTLPLLPVIRTAYVGFAFTLFVLVWLNLRGEKLADIGLIVPKKWPRYIAYGVLLFVAAVAWDILLKPAIDHLVVQWTGANPHQDADTFAMVKGNLALFLMVLPCIWLFAAFGEEVFYRGYLMSRIECLFGGSRLATASAILAQAVIFALGHWYQGPVGMVGVGIFGIIYGLGARLWGRNLWPNMIAHGLLDTLGFTLLYLGLMGEQ